MPTELVTWPRLLIATQEVDPDYAPKSSPPIARRRTARLGDEIRGGEAMGFQVPFWVGSARITRDSETDPLPSGYTTRA